MAENNKIYITANDSLAEMLGVSGHASQADP